MVRTVFYDQTVLIPGRFSLVCPELDGAYRTRQFEEPWFGVTVLVYKYLCCCHAEMVASSIVGSMAYIIACVSKPVALVEYIDPDIYQYLKK